MFYTKADRIEDLERQLDSANALVDSKRKLTDALRERVKALESRPHPSPDARLAPLRKELEQVKLAFALALDGDVGDTYTPQQVEKAKKRLAKNNLRLSYDDTTGQVHVLFPAPPEKPPWSDGKVTAGSIVNGTIHGWSPSSHPYTYGGYTY